MTRRNKTIQRNPDWDWPIETIAQSKPASAESIKRVTTAPVSRCVGRSQWVWIRLASGDLVIATYPRGDLYFETEPDWSGL
jgi:hypothetical protein